MLHRLFLLLLLIGLSVPAMAMTGHCAMAAPEHGHHAEHRGHHGKPAPAKTFVASNDCIGCVTPPVNARPKFRAALLAPLLQAPTDDALPLARAPEPATPPPRA
ncbi:MAG TPA: hypothetical protein VMQ93_09455 [Novosphingobium sp.]|nr:hypothetical protein [Novosphingobium sp.]